MRQRYLLVAALIALASPAAAQDNTGYTWTSDRPDGVASAGVTGDRILPMGALEVTYRFRKMTFNAVQLGTLPVDPLDVLEDYSTTPFDRTDRVNDLVLAYGASDRLTLLGTASWVDHSRSVANEEFFVSTSASGISDIEVQGLYDVFSQGAVRVHFHGGVEVPVGSTDKRGDLLDVQDQVLPYEMQPGSGSWSVIPGVTAQIQNEHGTVGAQLLGRIRLNDNDRGYRLGDQVEGAAWLEYMLNPTFALTSGARFRSWGSIEGVDVALDPTRDPGEDAVFSGGEEVDVPVGLNVYMRQGPLQGHRISAEFVFPVHQDFDAVRLAGDWGFTLSWRKAF